MISDVLTALPGAVTAQAVRRNPKLMGSGPLLVVRYGGSAPDPAAGRGSSENEIVRLVVTVVRREWESEGIEDARFDIIRALDGLRPTEPGEGPLKYEGSGEPVDFVDHSEIDVEFSYRRRIFL